ncbi:MAG: hypothetical protein WD009_07395, partial [Phycisphaeraceae bacterium]
MKLVRTTTGNSCTFRVCCHHAQQVKLVIQYDADGSQQILPLRQRAPGVWELGLELRPGLYRFCYHLFNGRSLTYLTPPGWAMEGLKALLHVPEDEPPHRGRSGAMLDGEAAAFDGSAGAGRTRETLVETQYPHARRVEAALEQA